MKESVKPPASIQWPIFFGGAVVGANVCSAAFGRCARGKVA